MMQDPVFDQWVALARAGSFERAVQLCGFTPAKGAGATIISRHDLAMLMTERNHLMARPPRPWGDLERIQPLRVTGRLKSVSTTAERRAGAYLRLLDMYCPQALRRR